MVREGSEAMIQLPVFAHYDFDDSLRAGQEQDVDLRRRFTIKDYDVKWPEQFSNIKADLEVDLAEGSVTYTSIEHIGSTSVPGLCSKATTDLWANVWEEAVIDICIVVPRKEFTQEKLAHFQTALRFGSRQGGYHYIGDGGVQDRWSFKLKGVVPLRNLYVVAKGSIPLRAYISLRTVLRKDEELRQEYGATKRRLAMLYDDQVRTYCGLKRPVIRKIFLADGWTNKEVDEAEAQAKRDWPERTPADFFEQDECDLLGEGAIAKTAPTASPEGRNIIASEMRPTSNLCHNG
ncbi:uncharacterized protein KY384_005927 [Bacidia gigantensis]|uniref:uncharacterized protein n=1 Tax=Bacidia gigantensis TaxID=2732470 RepID=UPI001D04B3E8|nr:uncharacterized protein KY384_005927 [Bacidia gigantensis]KAG8529292.1 hypothetical protein KY384_005927 [Bacidia gigantensis]